MLGSTGCLCYGTQSKCHTLLDVFTLHCVEHIDVSLLCTVCTACTESKHVHAKRTQPDFRWHYGGSPSCISPMLLQDTKNTRAEQHSHLPLFWRSSSCLISYCTLLMWLHLHMPTVPHRSSFYPQFASTMGSIVGSWRTLRCCKPSVLVSHMVPSPQCACKKTPAERAPSLTLTASPSEALQPIIAI